MKKPFLFKEYSQFHYTNLNVQRDMLWPLLEILPIAPENSQAASIRAREFKNRSPIISLTGLSWGSAVLKGDLGTSMIFRDS
ncbi:hypothetical protein ACQKM9_11620 [Viridibacillus sp. NPDC093762]|uniref:hypothetical protein n=1 Tax=Viridibacillus sp. NPDC093762 TaxID=3390720 RepID=UPI003D03D312